MRVLHRWPVLIRSHRRSTLLSRLYSIHQSAAQSEDESSKLSYTLEARLAAVELREKRAEASRRRAETILAKKQAAEVAASLPPRVGAAAFEPHTDLASYLDHVERHQVKTTTTVYKGTHFEYTVADALKKYNMQLKRTGKANDYGIDLIGNWILPDGHSVRVFLQCKLTKTMPALIRELEGAYTGAPSGWDDENVLAILASRHPASPGCRLAIQRSKFPLAMAQIDTGGSIRQFIWNHVASDLGLNDIGVTLHHRAEVDTDSVEITFTWHDRKWPANG